jgi:hypothetical protein
VDDDRGLFFAAQQPGRLGPLVDRGERDLGHPGQRLGGGEVLGSADRLQRGGDQGAGFGFGPGRPGPPAVRGPAVAEVVLRRRFVVGESVDGAQAADQGLDLPDGAVPGGHQQAVDQFGFTGCGDSGDRAGVGIGDPAGGHLRGEPGMGGEPAGDPDVFDRGAVRDTAGPAQPLRGGGQTVRRVTVPGVELGDQQQPSAGRRRESPGGRDDLLTELVDRRELGRIMW